MTNSAGTTRNRITGYDPAVDPTELLAHPLNARRHPGAQRDALRESLGKVGWVDVVKVNSATGHVVDGHARIEEALSSGDSVPVLYLDIDPDEERFVLATLDPIAGMATYDAEVLDLLLDGLEIESEGLSAWLGDAMEHAHLFDGHDDSTDEDGGTREDDESFSGDGEMLDALGSLVDDPTHQCERGQVWEVWEGRHLLVVANLHNEHKLWGPLLEPEHLFLPYPGPHVLMATAALDHRMLLVQPDAYIAGRILDTAVDVHGHFGDPVLR
jgi:hypothetical protein